MENKELALKDVREFTAADIKKYICPTADDKEFFEFCQIVKARNLNPFLKEVHFVKYGNKAGEIVVGKDAILKRAKKAKGYRGFKAGWFNESGDKLQFPIGKIYGAWCEVYAEDKETLFVPVLLSEYNPNHSVWKTKMATMIRKVAVVQAHREFAPEETGGMYDADEMATPEKTNDQQITAVWAVNLASIVDLPEYRTIIQGFLKTKELSPEDIRADDETTAQLVFDMLTEAIEQSKKQTEPTKEDPPPENEPLEADWFDDEN